MYVADEGTDNEFASNGQVTPRYNFIFLCWLADLDSETVTLKCAIDGRRRNNLRRRQKPSLG